MRQRYVANDLTHFVGRALHSTDEQYDLLIQILQTGVLRPRAEHSGEPGRGVLSRGQAVLSSNEKYLTDIVCFCDIPVADLEIHMRKYSQFGIAFSKQYLASKGASPVFYVARDSVIGGDTEKTRGDYFDEMSRLYEERQSDQLKASIGRFNQLRERIMTESGGTGGPVTIPDEEEPQVLADLRREMIVLQMAIFLGRDVFSFMKFFDVSRPEEDPANYYMEREWRVVGQVDFQSEHVSRVILPQQYAERFRQHMPTYYGQVHFAPELE